MAPEDDSPTARLLEELSAAKDFPALSEVVSQVNRIASSESSHADELTDAILRDLSLTNKLLRLVNSVHFGQFGHQPISTISRAVVILGFETVRDAALSLVLFDHLQDHAQAAELKSEAVESFFCGTLGRLLAGRMGHREPEEAFISALFRNLGRLLIRLHFYPRSKQVEELMAKQGLSEEVAARRVFGLSYDEIGQAVGRLWHLPANLLEGMAPLPAGAVKAPSSAGGRLQVLSNLARDLYLTVKKTPQEEWGRALSELSKQYQPAIELPAPELVDLLVRAGETVSKESAILQADPRSSPLLRQLLDKSVAADDADDADDIAEVGAAPITNGPNAVLVGGLQDLSEMLLADCRPGDLLHVLSELLFRSGNFDNVLICTLDAAGRNLVARTGHGRDIARLRAAFRIPVSFSPDVFHAAIAKGVDLLINDTGADNIRGRIPSWYTQQVGARSFLLLPLSTANRTVALIYADRRDNSIQLDAQALGLIKALRSQVLLALRQKTKAS